MSNENCDKCKDCFLCEDCSSCVNCYNLEGFKYHINNRPMTEEEKLTI